MEQIKGWVVSFDKFISAWFSNECSDCKTIFGEKYFCKICRLFDHKDKGQFHCEGCGICRWLKFFDPGKHLFQIVYFYTLQD